MAVVQAAPSDDLRLFLLTEQDRRAPFDAVASFDIIEKGCGLALRSPIGCSVHARRRFAWNLSQFDRPDAHQRSAPGPHLLTAWRKE